jgi:hypothetical protein
VRSRAERALAQRGAVTPLGATQELSPRLAALVCLAMACASRPPPAPVGLHKEYIPPELRTAVADAERIGRLLFRFDHMADVGTAFLASRIPDGEYRALAGSVTVVDSGADAFATVFLTRDAPARVAYRVHMRTGEEPVLESVTPPSAADEGLLSQFRASGTALAGSPKWNGAMKAVVLPGRMIGVPDSLAVYLIRRELHAYEVVQGMHYRVLVSSDGKTVQNVSPLSDVAECCHPETSPVISSFRLGHPSEVDVLSSLRHDKAPIFMASERVMWTVYRGEIGAWEGPPDRQLVIGLRINMHGFARQSGMPSKELPPDL